MNNPNRWKPARDDNNKIKMVVDSSGKYITYADFLEYAAIAKESELNRANAYLDNYVKEVAEAVIKRLHAPYGKVSK
jgi:hypothetical protein